MIALLRDKGVPGNIAYDTANQRILNETIDAIPVGGLVVAYTRAPAEARDELVERYVAAHLRGRQPIETWEEARTRVLPKVRPELEHVNWPLHARLEGGEVPSLPTSRITEHLRGQVVWEIEDGIAPVQAADVERWGITPDELQEAARQNLARRTPASVDWLGSPDSPGVFRSKWQDGFDATRAVFQRELGLPVAGPVVAIATSDSSLFVAASTDEDALFQLGLAAKRTIQTEMSMVWFWPLLLDGDERRHWLPSESSAAYAPLSFCAALHAQLVYNEHGKLLQRALDAQGVHLPVGQVAMFQTPTGASGTVAVWQDASPTAVAEANVVQFQRGEQTLGMAPIQRVQDVVGHLLEEIPGYPKRFRAQMFPEDWQLAELGITPG